MRLLAPAKINLHLRVGPRRADGFHPLLSWMTTVALFDTLRLEERPASAVVDAGVELTCDLRGLPCDERNLVVRIAQAWRAVAQDQRGAAAVGGVRATLEKRIPIGAGLGGGSSDGARALLGLNRLWNTGRAADDLSAFAARFGSDLPFFFHGPSSVCHGRGELVLAVGRPVANWCVLVLPPLSMPTPAVYRRFDEMGLGRDSDIEEAPDWNSWAALSSEELLPRLVNDLERPAFSIAPELGALREQVEHIVKRPVRMSGSGSSLFTLFDAEPQAKEMAAHIERTIPNRALAVAIAPIFRDDLNDLDGYR